MVDRHLNSLPFSQRNHENDGSRQCALAAAGMSDLMFPLLWVSVPDAVCVLVGYFLALGGVVAVLVSAYVDPDVRRVQSSILYNLPSVSLILSCNTDYVDA